MVAVERKVEVVVIVKGNKGKEIVRNREKIRSGSDYVGGKKQETLMIQE